MLRLGELLVAVGPFLGGVILVFLIYSGRDVPRRVLLLAVLAVMGLGGWLVWTGTSEGLERTRHYVPAVLRDGEVVQGHGR